MKWDEFVATTERYWGKYLARIDKLWRAGRIDAGDGTNLFPSMLLCTRTPRHYIAELVGAREGFSELAVKRQRIASAEDYFGQFRGAESDPAILLRAARNTFGMLTLSQDITFDQVRARFPFADLYPTKIRRSGGRGSPVAFGPGFQSCMFDNCMILNQLGEVFRAKHILNAIVVSHSVSGSELQEWLGEVQADSRVVGVHTCGPGLGEVLATAAQFSALYLSSSVRETTLGEFLRDHPRVLEEAARALRFVYEPYLEWVEAPEGNEDTAINPDLLVQRDDGDWDIYDLKTALLDQQTITKGGRRRRRFVDTVEEGIAQLAHYREYFSYPDNRARTVQKYDAHVKAPRLVLVVGTLENVRAEEVREASRRLGEVSVIDFDSLMQLFVVAAAGHDGGDSTSTKSTVD